MGSLMLLALIGAAAPVAAEAPADGAVRTAPAICRSIPSTGSRLGGRRACRTQAEWDELAQASRNDVRNAQQRQTAPTVDWAPGLPNGLRQGPQ